MTLLEQLKAAALSCPNVYGQPLGRAALRTEPSDFIVEEVLGFSPEGHGEFLYLWIEKCGQNTDWVAEELARVLDVKRRDVSYSGRKDRHAVTRQWFCVHWLKRALPTMDALNAQAQSSTGWQVLDASQHPRKLRTGTHKANMFTITLRDIDVDETERAAVDARLTEIGEQGVPNYFGMQRFGHDGSNIAYALTWLESGRAPRSKNRRSLQLSSLRSALFNHALAERVRDNTWASAVEGEYFVLNGARTGFSWDKRGDDWQTRLATHDVHPSISLAGKGALPLCDAALESAQKQMAGFEAVMEFLSELGVKVEQRASRLSVDELKWDWPEPKQLRVSFGLVRGAFATTVLGIVFDIDDQQVRTHE